MTFFIRDSNGQPVEILALARDITERKRLEDALRIKDDAIASSITPMAITDLAGILTYANPCFAWMWDYTNESEVRGKPIAKFLNSPEKAAEIMAALRVGSGYVGELVALRKDGSTFEVLLSASTVKNDNGEPVAMLASFIDISKRKQTEQQLQESLQFNSNLLNNSPYPIIVVNQDTSVQYINAAVEKLTGFSSAEVIGKKAPHPWWLEGEWAETRKSLSEAMERGTYCTERQFQKKNGECFWVEITGTPIMRDGKLQHYLASWVDISERKKVEEALRKEKTKRKTTWISPGPSFWQLTLEEK